MFANPRIPGGSASICFTQLNIDEVETIFHFIMASY
jgi:hypothetical protein